LIRAGDPGIIESRDRRLIDVASRGSPAIAHQQDQAGPS
jgi:hypothetical protein